jgi:hypothetical protein
MFLAKKRKYHIMLTICLVAAIISFGYVKAAYLTTNRDTKLPTDKVTYDITSFDEYELLYETDTIRYYYREDRDVLAIEDKRTGYTWKTGLDLAYNADIENALKEITDPAEKEKAALAQEVKMNATYIEMANSLVTVEYFDAESIKNVSSAAGKGVESSLVTLNNNGSTRRLDINFTELDLQIKVHVTFHEDSITYDIKDQDITGTGRNKIVAIAISPFLGASGGKSKIYNKESGMFDIEVDKYKIPGYIFVPDGSGSLIRFQDNSAAFSGYTGDIYGSDYTQDTFFNRALSDMVPLKNPVMPVFGIAHGDGQAAFVAYADSGAEYMQVIMKPEENMTYYNWAYPRFVYNTNYFQVYNKKGEGYFTLMEEPNEMNINMTYTFLAGDGTDGTPAADYTGMAATYRKHLIDEGILTETTNNSSSDIPLRLDFIMSDSKKGIVGTEEVVVTNTEDVNQMLSAIMEDGITNVNSGLYGWQKGGETLAKPGADKYSSDIGKEKDFNNLFTAFAGKGIDISYARDYTIINDLMIKNNGNAARHISSWYLELDKQRILPENSPVSIFRYATTQRSAEWFLDQFKRVSSYSESMTVGGLSEILLSTYDSDGLKTSVTEAITMYQETLEKATEEVKLNLENPNMYLWKYTDRYLQAPVGTSQYVFETDAVPFLQMVLHGTMEIYGPYSNFSFYTQADILRMIDYNLSPSFILSKEPSYLLASTVSADLYSTEFSQYEELIGDVYSQVNEVLGEVIGYTWTGRTVLHNGVIKNTYTNGDSVKEIIINYTDETVTYGQTKVAPLSASVIL